MGNFLGKFMKKILTKLATPLLLIVSVVFASLTFTPILTTTTYALPDTTEDNPENPTSPEGTENPDEAKSPEDPTDQPDEGTNTDNPEDGSSEEGSESGSATTDQNPDGTTTDDVPADTCRQEAGGLYWIVCPTINFISFVTDSLYSLINDFLVVQPLSMADDSPVYLIWQYVRSITNIVFVIFLILVIYAQLTGIGLDNYNIKRVLPRLIITVILVNLSFLICALLTDVSNVAGESLRSFFLNIQETISQNSNIVNTTEVSMSAILSTILTGGTIAGVVIGATGGLGGLLWALVPILVAALVAIITGLITIAARQAVITVLVMIAPLAMVAYLLPNTEKWFQQWKNMFARMLFFYPVFSFLYGASQLAGWAIIASASSAPMILLGLAVQIFPLFFSWSLMKMSGTFLSTLNNTMRKIAAPAENLATGWAKEHADRSRQDYWLNSHSTGSRLRSYLDYRQKLRLLDAKNAAEARENRALTRAYTKASSITGRDDQGNTTWTTDPNKYTRNAKTASYYATLSSTAQLAYKNTTSAYGRHFGKNAAAARLNDASGEAFVDAVAQNFLAVNEAQADQEYLLRRYLKAATDQNRNRYEYNRLIKGAAGGLDYNGESSIMGQVIKMSSDIEQRRRSEAFIVKNKFGYSKTDFRAMIHDMGHINDDGYETLEDGTVIEDSEYQLLTNPKTGKKYERSHWQHYLWSDNESNVSISREAYDALPETTTIGIDGTVVKGKDAYHKVRYMDIYNDAGDPVQRVFEDDAGYMKELITDDVNIGDPINKRYLSEIGVAHTDDESTGILRRYHSTIYAAMLNSSYKNHFAPATPMLLSQADHGFIAGKSQFNIASLLSFVASSKPGAFLVNDGVNIREMTDWIMAGAGEDEEVFSKFFTDQAIMNFRNVNGKGLKGLRLGTKDGKEAWISVPAEEASLEEKKNMIRHKVIPDAARKMVDAISRKMSPNVSENMKIDGLGALQDMNKKFREIAMRDESATSFAGYLQGDKGGIYDIPDAAGLETDVQQTRLELDQMRKGTGRYQGFAEKMERGKRSQQDRSTRNNAENIISHVEEIFMAHGDDYFGIVAALRSYFGEIESLANLIDQFEILFTQYEPDFTPTNEEEWARYRQYIEQLKDAVINLIINNPERQ